MDLAVFLEPKVDLPHITKILDELGPMGRLDTIRAWDRPTLRSLYEAAKGYRPLTLDHFVPPSVALFTEVIHDGKNSLAAFSHFQKRFARGAAKDSGEAVVFGYNHQEVSGWTGPGYFVVHPSTDSSGEVAIDYRELPAEKVDTWPTIIPNTARLGRFIYAGTVDVMRGISNHVAIGRARRGNKWMDAWFVLSRVDVS